MIESTLVERFLAISRLYLQITGNPSQDIAAIEIDEWLEIINSEEEPAAFIAQTLCIPDVFR